MFFVLTLPVPFFKNGNVENEPKTENQILLAEDYFLSFGIGLELKCFCNLISLQNFLASSELLAFTFWVFILHPFFARLF